MKPLPRDLWRNNNDRAFYTNEASQDQSKIEDAVEQSLDPFRIPGLFMDDSINFGAVFRMSLTRKPLYI